MIGTTLEDIRTYITELASATGEYYLVCARYGDRPVPASGLRFESRAAAAAAARATEQYRAALRRYDPRLPRYDIVVCQMQRPEAVTDSSPTHQHRCSGSETEQWTLSKPVINRPSTPSRALIEFCHRVAAAVFETLSAREHDGVESNVMDSYLDLAEQISSPDRLCLCLLESIATELATRLPPSEQVTILEHAASRLIGEPPNDPTVETDIEEPLSRLPELGLVESYRYSGFEADTGCRYAESRVRLTDYALSPQAEHLPLLPVLLELYRHGRKWVPVSTVRSRTEDEWVIELTSAGDEITTLQSAYPLAPEVV